MSAAPRSTAATCACGFSSRMAISSGKPPGRSRDDTSKCGLRTSTPPRPGTQRSIVYGPVPGTARVLAALAGLPAGTTKMLTSLCRKSGSGRRRWMVTVLAAESVSMPFERSQCSRLQRAAPRTAGTSGRKPFCGSIIRRSIDARTSSGLTRAPFEKRTFRRSLNTYVRSSALGSGTSMARFATSVPPAEPPARR